MGNGVCSVTALAVLDWLNRHGRQVLLQDLNPKRRQKNRCILQYAPPHRGKKGRGVTFEKMCAMEPKLRSLLAKVQAVRDHGSQPSFCRLNLWFGYSDADGSSYRTRLAQLVGYNAFRPSLKNPDFYDTAEDALLALLPPCRNCNCVIVQPAAPVQRRRYVQPRMPAAKFVRLTEISPNCPHCHQPMPHATKTKAEQAAAA
jgi:hypothetical protein